MTSTKFGNLRNAACGCVLLLLAGCGAVPASGPTVRDITGNAGPETGYAVVPLAPAVLTTLETLKLPSLAETFGDVAPIPVRTLSAGDVVSITIWDAGGGLFAPANPTTTSAGTQTTVIPNQAVDQHGNITVPFGGQVHVAGITTLKAQQKIEASLANKALNPQVLVTVASDQGNLVTVVGDVKAPGRVLATANGTRVLDAIALAGGTTSPAFDTLLQLTRGPKTTRVRLSSVLARPAENIYLKPDDVVYAVHDPMIVAVLGATKNNGRIQFDREHLTLSEVLGQSGGLVDDQSEPAGVFVFRFEPASLVAALKNQAPTGPDQGPGTPVIFRADLRHAQDFFLAQAFQMQDKDIVYVANTESVQIDKVLKVLLHAAGIAGTITGRNGLALSQ